jgi:hypothetical protein
MSEEGHNWANESQDTTAPIKRKLSDSKPGRFDPEFCAGLIEYARDRIQSVWADVPEGVSAQVLAENVVHAQEWLWLSLQNPLATHDERVRTEERERCAQIAEAERDLHDAYLGSAVFADVRWEQGGINAADLVARAIRAVSAEHADHPHTDPGAGRKQCPTCGKYVWPSTHSCKGIRVAVSAEQEDHHG